MSRRYILVAVLTILLAGAIAWFSLGSSAPPGQPALQSLTPANLPALEASFNAAKDDIRILVLLSPT